ncbi:hypothetical protein M5K25_007397 [Dendrobium thyrsiflorum]|uniref:Uncharacterized protein n=1 Tax=Dendrobium thyrsiflorum TaxID=117978 RepID=A0ABD0VE96_DENTH
MKDDYHVVRLGSFDDVPCLPDRKLRHFDRKQNRNPLAVRLLRLLRCCSTSLQSTTFLPVEIGSSDILIGPTTGAALCEVNFPPFRVLPPAPPSLSDAAPPTTFPSRRIGRTTGTRRLRSNFLPPAFFSGAAPPIPVLSDAAPSTTSLPVRSEGGDGSLLPAKGRERALLSPCPSPRSVCRHRRPCPDTAVAHDSYTGKKGTNLFSTFVSSRSTAYTRISLRGGKGTRCDAYDEASKYLPDQYKFVLDVRVEPVNRLYTKCVAVLVAKRVIQKSLFRCSRWTGKPPIRALLQRCGMGNRCDAYNEKGIFISTRLRGNDCASFRQEIVLLRPIPINKHDPFVDNNSGCTREDPCGHKSIQRPSRPIIEKIHQSKSEAYDEPDPPSLRVRTWHVSSTRWFRHPNGTTPMVLPPNGTVDSRAHRLLDLY